MYSAMRTSGSKSRMLGNNNLSPQHTISQQLTRFQLSSAAVYCSDLVLGMYAKAEHSILVKKSSHIIGNVLIHPTAEVDPSAVVLFFPPLPQAYSFLLLTVGSKCDHRKERQNREGCEDPSFHYLGRSRNKGKLYSPSSLFYPHHYKSSRRMRASCMVSLDGSVLWVNGRA